MNSSQDEDAKTIFQERSQFVQVKKTDVESLKDEYKLAQVMRFAERDDEAIRQLNHGMARGLEMALIRMGVTNDECDRLTRKAYQEAQG